jgi:hypothetical protein
MIADMLIIAFYSIYVNIILIMSSFDHLEGSALAEQQLTSERDFLLRRLADTVDGIAANEVAYEIASLTLFDTEVDVDLSHIAEEAATGRANTLVILNEAITAAKGVYRARHQQLLEKNV